MDQKEMDAWMKVASPAKPHEYFTKLEGSWNCKTRFWMQPGAPPQESSGTAENKIIFDGRFMQCSIDAVMMGQPFKGMALDGYDNLMQKYVGIWIDTMGTMMMVFQGTCDGTVREMIAEYKHPMTKQMTKMKGITRVLGKNEHVYEGWNLGPDGEFFKGLEVSYKRR